MLGRKKEIADHTQKDTGKYFSFYKGIGTMIEAIGFDTRNLLWIAKKNEEAFVGFDNFKGLNTPVTGFVEGKDSNYDLIREVQNSK